MITIDGSMGEGGGQVLRTSLALSLHTGRPFRMERIRAGREKPGLMRQHLTAVKAAAEICGAKLEGAELKSTSIEFTPGRVVPGEYRFDIGTAGSSTLVLQTVLPPLMTADAGSQISITGGTCNPKAPPVEFLVRAFLPLLRRMGARVELTLNAHGFYPAGGGEIAVTIEPRPLSPIELLEIGERRVTAKILLAKLPQKIAERELEVLAQQLELAGSEIDRTDRSGSPGNAVFVVVEGATTEVFTGFGERGVPGWKVAGAAADETLRFLEAEVPVGEHLADQLLIPLALAKGGRFLTVAPSLHTTTNIEIVERFLPARIQVTRHQEKAEISVS